MHNLMRNVALTRVCSGLSASTTDHLCTAIDMRGYRGCTFIAAFGALTTTAVTSIYLQTATSSGGTMSTQSGTRVSIDDELQDGCLIMDVYDPNPDSRWLQCVIDRGTANAVVDSVIALQYNPNASYVTHSTDTVYAAEYNARTSSGTA